MYPDAGMPVELVCESGQAARFGIKTQALDKLDLLW